MTVVLVLRLLLPPPQLPLVLPVFYGFYWHCYVYFYCYYYYYDDDYY